MLFIFYNRAMLFSKVEVCEFLDNTNQNLFDRHSILNEVYWGVNQWGV